MQLAKHASAPLSDLNFTVVERSRNVTKVNKKIATDFTDYTKKQNKSINCRSRLLSGVEV